MTISDDEPMTLAEACETIFRGHIKPATLRAEAARGRLVIERIGRRDFVTLRAINAMREKCRLSTSDEFDPDRPDPQRVKAASAAAYASARDLRARSDRIK